MKCPHSRSSKAEGRRSGLLREAFGKRSTFLPPAACKRKTVHLKKKETVPIPQKRSPARKRGKGTWGGNSVERGGRKKRGGVMGMTGSWGGLHK